MDPHLFKMNLSLDNKKTKTSTMQLNEQSLFLISYMIDFNDINPP